MWHEERRQRIRSLLNTFGRVSIDRITGELGVSRESIRRDLLELEAEGVLRRVRGGAVAAEERREAPYRVRSSVRVREKRAIAAAASQSVESGHTLFLDAGSTTAILSERLAVLSGLTVITNSVDVARQISKETSASAKSNWVVLLGGEFKTEPPATFGEVTINEVARYQADIAMLSPFGLEAGKGATSYDSREAEIARAMIANARDTMLLADYSKIGLVSRVAYCGASDISHLVVDAKASDCEGFAELSTQVGRVTVASR